MSGELERAVVEYDAAHPEPKFTLPLDDVTNIDELQTRIEDLEQMVVDCAELIRHMGQTLSWTLAGQRLNDPPQHIRDAQRRLTLWGKAIRAVRGPRNR